MNDVTCVNNFVLAFHQEPDGQLKKSCNITYSPILKKLWVRPEPCVNIFIAVHPVHCHQSMKVVSYLVFKNEADQDFAVERCPKHLEEDKASAICEYVLQCQDIGTTFERLGQHFINCTPVQASHYIEMACKFNCLATCQGGINRRPLQLVLEFYSREQSEILGKIVVDIQLSSCPGRDRKKAEEKKDRKDQKKKVKKGFLNTSLKRKRRKGSEDGVTTMFPGSTRARARLLSLCTERLLGVKLKITKQPRNQGEASPLPPPPKLQRVAVIHSNGSCAQIQPQHPQATTTIGNTPGQLLQPNYTSQQQFTQIQQPIQQNGGHHSPVMREEHYFPALSQQKVALSQQQVALRQQQTNHQQQHQHQQQNQQLQQHQNHHQEHKKQQQEYRQKQQEYQQQQQNANHQQRQQKPQTKQHAGHMQRDFAKSQNVCRRLDRLAGLEKPIYKWYWPPDSTISMQEPELNNKPELIEMLPDLTNYLRNEHRYCIWCGMFYEDRSVMLLSCPGPSRYHHDL